MILTADVLAGLRTLPDASVQCVVTSPPYWGLRDYGIEGQIGSEPTIAQYVAKMVEVFAEVHRVLKKDGVLWLNLGDSYCSSATGVMGSQCRLEGGKTTQQEATKRPCKLTGELKPKDRCMIPARVAIALQDWGWWRRDEIIWAKPNPMPSSVQDRTTPAHEMIYLLSKSKKYFYDAAAIRTALHPVTIQRHTQPNYENQEGCERYSGQGMKMRIPASQRFGGPNSGFRKKHCPNNAQPSEEPTDGLHEAINGANARSVWTIATQAFKECHFATFPQELPRRCILAGSRPGDTVLDPFAGSGTTLLVARRYGRIPWGIELNPEYVKLIERRLADETPPLLTP